MDGEAISGDVQSLLRDLYSGITPGSVLGNIFSTKDQARVVHLQSKHLISALFIQPISPLLFMAE